MKNPRSLATPQPWLDPRILAAIQGFVILLAGWLVFSPVLHGAWLWDDNTEITRNPELRDAAWWKIWWSPATADYLPLKSSVQWLEWRLWHDDSPVGYHLVTLGFHLLAAFLVWRIFRQLGLRLAWLGGLIFAIHPLAVESVAWLAEMKNTLSLVLLLCATSAWLRYDLTRRRPDYFFALGWFIAAMLSKGSVVMFPVILLLHAWWKRGRVVRADIRRAAPFFAISLGLGLVTIWFQQHRAIASWDLPIGGFLTRIAGAGLAQVFYLSKSLLPVGLLPMYPAWEIDPPSPLEFLPWILLGGLFVCFWLKRREWGRHALFGFGFFVVNLLPVLGFISMSYLHITWVADHFVYLPLIGLVGVAVAALGAATARLPGSLRRLAFGAVGLVLVLLAMESRSYARIFRGPEELWTYVLERNPEAWMAHNNLGIVLLDQNKPEEAAAHFDEALRLKSGYVSAHVNLGDALLRTGRWSDAILHEQMALALDPGSVEAQFNWGNALVRSGQAREAIGHYEAALRLAPPLASADLHYNLGNALVQLERFPEAVTQYEAALRLGAPKAEMHFNLATVLAAMSRLPEALPQFTAAVRLDPNLPGGEFGLADALAESGRTADSIPHYEAALRLDPGNAALRASYEAARRRLGR